MRRASFEPTFLDLDLDLDLELQAAAAASPSRMPFGTHNGFPRAKGSDVAYEAMKRELNAQARHLAEQRRVETSTGPRKWRPSMPPSAAASPSEDFFSFTSSGRAAAKMHQEDLEDFIMGSAGISPGSVMSPPQGVGREERTWALPSASSPLPASREELARLVQALRDAANSSSAAMKLAEVKYKTVCAERDAALIAAEDERSERETTELLLQDAAEELCTLRSRNRTLALSLAEMMRQSGRGDGSSGGGGGGGGGGEGNGAGQGSSSNFGLGHTRDAIEKAVKEAAALPAEERRKKIRALRLKWHPDKHEVLKEMAGEVSKMINECVSRLIKDVDDA